MNPDLDAALVRDFPQLYADRNGDMRSTAMCWGFECGDGWEPLLRTLSEQLAYLALVQKQPVRASQVKEKFGTLRFYVDDSSEIMDACIDRAEHRSAYTCMVCGANGRVRGRVWVAALCAQHAYEGKFPLNDYEAKCLSVTDHIPEVKTDA